jgi:hypothetical protein
MSDVLGASYIVNSVAMRYKAAKNRKEEEENPLS